MANGGSRKLRKELHRINNLPLAEHERAIRELNISYSCSLVQKAPAMEDLDFRCHAYSLRIHKHQLMQNKIIRENFLKGSSAGLWWKFHGRLQTIMKLLGKSEVVQGDVVFYLRKKTDNVTDMRVSHSGRIAENGLVISKWGKGHVWKHETGHVPDNYEDEVGGISVVYYRPDLEAIKKYFEEYAHRVIESGKTR